MKITHARKANIYTSIMISSSLQGSSKGYFFTGFRTAGVISKDTTASALIQSYFFSMNNNSNVESLLHSTPTYSHTSSKVTIHVFYFSGKKNNNNNSKEKFAPKVLSSITMSSLSNSLAAIYKKEVSLVITRIHYPYLNSSIFAKYLAHNAPSNTFVHFKNSILTYPSRNASRLPAYISGIKIELAGRLLTERLVPRITKKISLFGSFSGPVDYAKYTTKNELGAFTLKI
jgi:hypothetical protein